MTIVNTPLNQAALKAGTASFVLALLALPAAGLAQTAAPTTTTAAAEEVEDESTIIVTGSLLGRADAITASPVTVLNAANFDDRAVTTIQEGLQQLTSNNGPALTTSFTANGAFGAGASAVSLRGLTTSSTLVLFDGLRAAYYPLSDDGARNFVDLNTIPDDIVERVEILRDGASSSYGADAVAGVVNVITKRSFNGLSGRAEAGISERGDAENQRLSLTLGTGDLDAKGYNAYISAFYVHSAALKNSTRPYPFNTDDQRGICFEGTCGPNGIINGLNANNQYPNNGFATGASTLFVQPYDSTNTTRLGRYQLLNPGAGCNGGGAYNPTAAELAGSNNVSVPTTLCQEDVTNRYGNILPKIERFGVSARGSFQLGADSEAYLAVNFQQSTVGYDGLPGIIRANAPAGIRFPRYRNDSGATVLTLPIFVCASGVSCDTAADRRLNPNNPFAAQGQVARLVGRLNNIREFNETRSRVYRAAAGLSGTIFDDVSYNLGLTAMHNDLRRTSEGYTYIQGLIDAVATGNYNFVNPAANTQAQIDAVSPDNITDSSSDLYQAEVSFRKPLFDLPGGTVQLAIGGGVRYEAIDAPSANDDFRGQTQRYFRLNAFGTSGNRTVYSAFGEIGIPVFEQLEVNLSGRYDNYSSGQSAFSPKAGVVFRPIEQITLRGTYSRGFRIPSFAESNALPTTGFVTQSLANIPASFLAQYGANCRAGNAAGCPNYITAYSIGLTSIGTEGLKPEKSRSFTGGIVIEPIKNVRFTVDYYNIKVNDAITFADQSPAIAAYYAGQAIPSGFSVQADAPDINFPNALPRIALVQSGYINANTTRSQGIDLGLTAQFPITDTINLTTRGEASYIIELSTSLPDGTTQQYAGTLGNFNLTAGSGTPEWRASLQATLDFGAASLTGSANYFAGYNLSAADQGNEPGDCGLTNGNTPCDIASYTTVDLTGNVKLNDNFTFYVNVLNVANRLPPIDTVTYGAHFYNAVQGGTGIIGRAYRAGVRVNF